mgnify:CR=1 FL=1
MTRVKVKLDKILSYNGKTYYPDTIINIENENEVLKLLETENVELINNEEFTDHEFKISVDNKNTNKSFLEGD